MWFALLFNEQDELLAAAPAAPVHAMGREYWRDIYASEVAFSNQCQTAYLNIESNELIQKLESLESSDEHLAECRARIDELTSAFRNVSTTRQTKAA